MLKILDEKVLKTDDEIEELYKDCKYLTIIDSYDKIADNDGYLYCVGTFNALQSQTKYVLQNFLLTQEQSLPVAIIR